MSNYDFSKATAIAQSINNGDDSSNKSYKYPLVYPAPNSTLVLRVLFNPASGNVVRLINRHGKIPCYKTYNQECPICKVQQQVKDLTGQDPFARKDASKSRGIAYAQFVSSTTPIKKNETEFVNPGDIVLFMFPWSVYQQINASIQGFGPTGMERAFTHADEGFFIQVQVGPDFKYTTTQLPYMSNNFGYTDETFLAMLDGMDSLLDQVIPESITEEVDKQVKEYATSIQKEYITPAVPNQGPINATPVNYGTPTSVTPTPIPTQAQAQPVYQPTPTPVASPASRPQCFGCHEDGSPKCIVCPDEMMCMQSK